MERRRLGQTDVEVSVVGLGCNNFGWTIDKAQSALVIEKALDRGVTYFDTAEFYSASEDIIGEVLGPRRKDIVLATKFGMPLDEERKGASRRYIMSAVESSLRRLRTDWIDHYQLHRPDPDTPIEETLRALEDLVCSGKVRAIGCSKLSPEQLDEAQETALAQGLSPFATTQNEYSALVRREADALRPVVEKYRMSLVPYFPLANGLLTGKYRSIADIAPGGRLSTPGPSFEPYRNSAMLETARQLGEFAASRGKTLVELAFCWLLAQPMVASVIAGATKPEQVEQNAASASWTMTADELAQVDRIVTAGLGGG